MIGKLTLLIDKTTAFIFKVRHYVLAKQDVIEYQLLEVNQGGVMSSRKGCSATFIAYWPLILSIRKSSIRCWTILQFLSRFINLCQFEVLQRSITRSVFAFKYQSAQQLFQTQVPKPQRFKKPCSIDYFTSHTFVTPIKLKSSRKSVD